MKLLGQLQFKKNKELFIGINAKDNAYYLIRHCLFLLEIIVVDQIKKVVSI